MPKPHPNPLPESLKGVIFIPFCQLGRGRRGEPCVRPGEVAPAHAPPPNCPGPAAHALPVGCALRTSHAPVGCVLRPIFHYIRITGAK